MNFIMGIGPRTWVFRFVVLSEAPDKDKADMDIRR